MEYICWLSGARKCAKWTSNAAILFGSISVVSRCGDGGRGDDETPGASVNTSTAVAASGKGKGHVRESYRMEVRDSYFHDASKHGGGGHGYGVMLSRNSSNSLVENNIFQRLRRGLILRIGASGNVMSCNYVQEARSEASYYPSTSRYTDLSIR